MNRACLVSSDDDVEKNVEIDSTRNTLTLNNAPKYMYLLRSHKLRQHNNTDTVACRKRLVLPFVKGYAER